jgi:hypothetical protein
MASRVMVSQATDSNRVVRVMVNKSQTTTNSSSRADTVNKTRAEVLEKATTTINNNNNNRKVAKLTVNNREVQRMARGSMAKAVNNLAMANRDMSMLAWIRHIAILSLTALFLVNKLKAMADRMARRRVTVAS